MKIKLDPGAMAPVRMHETDAGMDLFALEDALVPANDHKTVHTGVHVQLPAGTCGILVSRSGMNIRHGVITTGLIDEGYIGEILVSVINGGSDDYLIHKGDRITQLIVVPANYDPVEIVDSLEDPGPGGRGTCGHGSTGMR